MHDNENLLIENEMSLLLNSQLSLPSPTERVGLFKACESDPSKALELISSWGDLSRLSYTSERKISYFVSWLHRLCYAYEADFNFYEKAFSFLNELSPKERRISIEKRDDDGASPLVVAFSSGNINAARVLVEMGANLDTHDLSGLGILHAAAFSCDIDTIKYALEIAPSQINEISSGNEDMLDAMGRWPESKDCFDEDAVPRKRIGGDGWNEPFEYDDAFRAELPEPGDSERLELFPNEGMTPLHCVAEACFFESVPLLSEKGADFRQVDLFGRTPASIAAQNGSVETLTALFDAYGIDALTSPVGRKSPLLLAAAFFQPGALLYILDALGKHGTPRLASMINEVEAVLLKTKRTPSISRPQENERKAECLAICTAWKEAVAFRESTSFVEGFERRRKL